MQYAIKSPEPTVVVLSGDMIPSQSVVKSLHYKIELL